MCYAIPGKIVDVKPGLATLDYFGETRRARNDFFDLALGDYVYAQGGFIIQKVREDEALLSLEAWKELFFELKKTDDRLSQFDKKSDDIDKETKRIINKAQNRRPITKEEALILLNIENEKEKEVLFKTANSIRQKFLSNACCVHGIIEFSNFCSCDCLYCGIRKSNDSLPRYRMQPKEILDSIKEAVDLGFKAIVLQSGEDSYYTAQILEDLVKEIRSNYPVLIFLSVGERDYNFYERIFKAGARGVLLRFETSDKGLYEKIKLKANFQSRLSHLKFLKELGYLIATGGLLGLPGQSKEDLIEDIFLAKSFGTEMYSFGPFIPHPNTPLKDTALISKEEALKFITVTRLIVPDAKILVTTALETLGEGTRKEGLLSGANSFMLNVTPLRYRKYYEIYQNRANAGKDIREQIDEALTLLKEIGRAPTDLGMS